MKISAYHFVVIFLLCIFGIVATDIMYVKAAHNVDRLADAMVGIHKDYTGEFWKDLWGRIKLGSKVFNFVPFFCYLVLLFSQKARLLYFWCAAIFLTPIYAYMLFVNGNAFENGCKECEGPEILAIIFYAVSVVSAAFIVIINSIMWAYKNVGRKLSAPNKSLKDAP